MVKTRNFQLLQLTLPKLTILKFTTVLLTTVIMGIIATLTAVEHTFVKLEL